MKTFLISLLVMTLFMACKKEETAVAEEDFLAADTTNTNTAPNEPVQVYIHSVTDSPTDSESITLKNNSGATADISAWTLGDKNNPIAYNIPANTILAQGEYKTFTRTTLGFQINDSGRNSLPEKYNGRTGG